MNETPETPEPETPKPDDNGEDEA